jgi:hypothetical protein
LYLISARIERGSPLDRVLVFYRRPVVVHWVGTDVPIAAAEHERGNLSRRAVERPLHWCDAAWLADELAEIGIGAQLAVLPVVGLGAGSPPPLPGQFRVLLYLPVDDYDREVFDMDTILALPHAFPDVSFILVPSTADTLPGPLPPNLELPGWQPLGPIYERTSVYVRLTHHDGISFSVLEALSRGRHVIWTYPIPGGIRASGSEAVREAVAALHAAHREGQLALNVEGMEHARSTYDPQRLARDIDGRLRRLLRRR